MSETSILPKTFAYTLMNQALMYRQKLIKKSADGYKSIMTRSLSRFQKSMSTPQKSICEIDITNINDFSRQINIIEEVLSVIKAQLQLPDTIPMAENPLMTISNPDKIIGDDEYSAKEMFKNLTAILKCSRHGTFNDPHISKCLSAFVQLLKDFNGIIDCNFMELYNFFVQKQKKCTSKDRIKKILDSPNLRNSSAKHKSYVKEVCEKMIKWKPWLDYDEIPPLERNNREHQEEK